jgi:hypothetical protein
MFADDARAGIGAAWLSGRSRLGCRGDSVYRRWNERTGDQELRLKIAGE